MCKIIAICNQKGGVGKTNVAENLGIGLVRRGKKVLLIDSDPQGSLTISLGNPNQDELETTFATVISKIVNKQPLMEREGILTHFEGVDLLPGNIDTTALEQELMNATGGELMVKKYINSVKDKYDYVIFDCMPSLGKVVINILTCADSVIIPVQAAYLPVVLLSAVIVSLCKLFGNRKIRLITLSGDVLNVLASYSLIEVCICYLIMKNAIVIKSVYCYIISFITLSLLLAVYYLVLILIRKMTALNAKQHEYEKHVAQFAYEQKKVKSERMVKHDIKRKMLEYIYLLENEEYDKLNYILQCQYEELKYLDEEMYSFNPVVNSVLRGCIGKIKGRDIKVETDINIPGDVEFFDGDFGTLLSNLVDNAIEACEKVEPERRYINLIIKVVEENMFIHIENSKVSAPVDINVSTKDNPDSHGIGVARVKEIFDKYDGKVKFEQKQDRFVVKGFLNCKNWYQGIA